MATPAQLQALVAARATDQPFWMTQKDEHVDVDKYSSSDGSKPVIEVRVLANQVRGHVVADGKEIALAHFRILLVLDATSVELNSMGLSDDGTTELVVASRNWVTSLGNAVKLGDEVILPVEGKVLTVDNILDILVRNGRHHYRLHTSGSGCRYWTKVVLEDLIRAGFLPVGSEGVVATIMANISRSRPQIYMLANAEGQFF